MGLTGKSGKREVGARQPRVRPVEARAGHGMKLSATSGCRFSVNSYS